MVVESVCDGGCGARLALDAKRQRFEPNPLIPRTDYSDFLYRDSGDDELHRDVLITDCTRYRNMIRFSMSCLDMMSFVADRKMIF